MCRYQTRWYVTTDESKVSGLIEIDGTPQDKVRFTPDVYPVHVYGTWIYWSDGKLTTSVGSHLEKGGSLSRDAERFFELIHGSDTGFTECSLETLAHVRKTIERKTIFTGGSRGHYAAEEVEEIVVELNDGTQMTLYVHHAGYFEGYQYDVYTSLETLKNAGPATGVDGMTAFPPDDFDYDETLGYVKRD